MSPEERYNRLLRFLSGEDERPDWMHRQSGWAQSGTLVTCMSNSIVKLMVERFDRAAMYTVQIGLNVGDGGFPVQAQAEVVFSINGTPIRRVVSVSQGVSISGVTESARVTVYDVTPILIDEEIQTQNVEYVALINTAPGPRAATTLPPFLRAWSTSQTLGASDNTSLLVPGNAGVVGFRLSVSAEGTSGATVQMTDPNGVIYDQYIVPPGVNSVFVPLASGTTQLLITNNDTANPIVLSGQWAIDG
jgi:hypothetical protein